MKASTHKPWRPRMLQEIDARCQEVGLVRTTHEYLAAGNIAVTADDEFDRLRDHGKGILFVGDHRNNRWEFIAIMDLLAQMGRSDMHLIARPHVKRQVAQFLGVAAAEVLLPVHPRM